jgi:hypothetical protein
VSKIKTYIIADTKVRVIGSLIVTEDNVEGYAYVTYPDGLYAITTMVKEKHHLNESIYLYRCISCFKSFKDLKSKMSHGIEKTYESVIFYEKEL